MPHSNNSSFIPQSFIVRLGVFLGVCAVIVFGLIALNKEDLEFSLPKPGIAWATAQYLMVGGVGLLIGLLTPAKGVENLDLLSSEIWKFVGRFFLVGFVIGVTCYLNNWVKEEWKTPLYVTLMLLTSETAGSLLRGWHAPAANDDLEQRRNLRSVRSPTTNMDREAA